MNWPFSRYASPAILLVCLLFLSSTASAQGFRFMDVIGFASDEQFRHTSTYRPFGLVEAPDDASRSAITEVVRSAVFLSPEHGSFVGLLTNTEKQVSMQLPLNSREEITLRLQEVPKDMAEARIFLASNPDVPYAELNAKFYWGIVDGTDRSMVSISVFDNEMIGYIYRDGEEFTIGRLENRQDGQHILYRHSDLLVTNTATCFTEDEAADPIPVPEGYSFSSRAVVDNCVRVYVEVNNNIVEGKGSIAAATAHALGIFSQVSLLYANEGVKLFVSDLLLWDVKSPYDGPDSGDFLRQFRNLKSGNFNGDIGHLLGYGGGGGIAYVDAVCHSDRNVAYSGIDANFNHVPLYSWSVMVVTHEIGHNVGSPHTHSCFYFDPETGMTIDGCGPAADYNEGCEGPIPSKGTIMSYCHLVAGVGMDFNLGFGIKPGDQIRFTIENSACLSTCDAPVVDAGFSKRGATQPPVCGAAYFNVAVTLTNFSAIPLESVDIYYQLNDNPAEVIHWTGLIGSFGEERVILPEIFLTDPETILTVYTSSPNGEIDVNPDNDVVTFSFKNGNTWYVDQVNGNDNNDGDSWESSWKSLSPAMLFAQPCDTILVAAGTYYPTENGFDRSASFYLRNNLAIYGGYGQNENGEWERRPAVYHTILSGDIDRDGTLAGNVYTVVIGSETDTSAVLDGFVITGGNANGLGQAFSTTRSGGGMYISSGSPLISHCIFYGNYARNDGGGLTCRVGSRPRISNCIFSGNTASLGGALMNSSSHPEIVNCTFTGNVATTGGGAIANTQSSNPVLVNNIVWDNESAGIRDTLDASIRNANSNPALSYNLIQHSGSSEAWNSAVGVDAGNNLDENPLFELAYSADQPLPGGDFRPQPFSAAINAGNNSVVSELNDIFGDTRIYDELVDLGAVEYQQTVSSSEDISPAITGLKVYPNPARDRFYVDLTAFGTTSGQIYLFDMFGQLIQSVTMQSGGIQGLSVGHVAPGIYVLMVVREDGMVARERLMVE